MKKLLVCARAAAAAIGAAAVCGCSLFSSPEQSDIVYYDLQQPEKISSVPILVDQFVSFSGERQRMARRKNTTLISGNDFHKWVQPPGGLITRYLQLAFRNEAADDLRTVADPAELRGEVLTFDCAGDAAVLGVRYHLRRGKNTFSKTVLFREKLEHADPESFSRAMSKAADRLARQIAADAARLPATEVPAKKGK